LKARPWLSSFQLLTDTLDNEAAAAWEAVGQEKGRTGVIWRQEPLDTDRKATFGCRHCPVILDQASAAFRDKELSVQTKGEQSPPLFFLRLPR
jgi:hypothetical protein